MSLPYVRHKNITGSAQIAAEPGNFYGFCVNSHTNGTLKIWDSLTAANDVILNTITFAAGSGIVVNLPQGLNYSVGLFATIGGTADITIFYGGIDR